jgi:hypothetical protein
LADNGHEDRNLFPSLYMDPRKGRATGTFMRKAANHFAGLASGTPLWDDGDGTHLDNPLNMFFIENVLNKKYINIIF